LRQAIIETERLNLCAPCNDDLEVLAELWGDAETMRFVGGDGAGWTRERVIKWLDRQIGCHKKHGMSYWTIILRDTGEIIGQGGLEPIKFNGAEIELAYQFGRAYWGMGYATEVARASAMYGIEALGLDRFVAMAYPQNKPSIRVLEKVGFRYIGETDVYYDTMLNVYEMIRPAEN